MDANEGGLRLLARRELDRLLHSHPMPAPELDWRAFRTTAGRADARRWRISLGTRVLTDEAAMVETLRHEYAHLLAVHREGPGALNHGPAWRRAMAELGEAPTRCHRLPVARNVPRQRVRYGCRRCGATLVRSRRLPANRRYVHAGCGGGLRLEGIERLAPDGAPQRLARP